MLSRLDALKLTLLKDFLLDNGQTQLNEDVKKNIADATTISEIWYIIFFNGLFEPYNALKMQGIFPTSIEMNQTISDINATPWYALVSRYEEGIHEFKTLYKKGICPSRPSLAACHEKENKNIYQVLGITYVGIKWLKQLVQDGYLPSNFDLNEPYFANKNLWQQLLERDATEDALDVCIMLLEKGRLPLSMDLSKYWDTLVNSEKGLHFIELLFKSAVLPDAKDISNLFWKKLLETNNIELMKILVDNKIFPQSNKMFDVQFYRRLANSDRLGVKIFSKFMEQLEVPDISILNECDANGMSIWYILILNDKNEAFSIMESLCQRGYWPEITVLSKRPRQTTNLFSEYCFLDSIWTILFNNKKYALIELLFDHHLLPHLNIFKIEESIKQDLKNDPTDQRLLKLSKQINNIRILGETYNMLPFNKFAFLLTYDENIYKFLYVFYSIAPRLPADIWKVIGSYFLLEPWLEVEAFVKDDITKSKFIKYHTIKELEKYKKNASSFFSEKSRADSLISQIKVAQNSSSDMEKQVVMSRHLGTTFYSKPKEQYQKPFNDLTGVDEKFNAILEEISILTTKCLGLFSSNIRKPVVDELAQPSSAIDMHNTL